MNEYMYTNEKEEFQLSNETAYMMKEASLWGKILAIIGFVSIGLLLLFTLVVGIVSAMGGSDMALVSSPGLFVLLSIILCAICFFPVYFLYSSSVRMRKALITQDAQVLTGSFESLKNYFLFNVIMSVIGLLVGFVGLFGIAFTVFCC